MLNKLTKKQEKGILEWEKHCLKIGYDTSPINKKVVEKSWKKFYKILGKKDPIFWYCQSPLQAQIIINMFPEIEKIIKRQKGNNIRNNIGNNIWNNIGNKSFRYIPTYSWCQHDINWIGYYKYYEKYGLLPSDENFKIFDIWYKLACSCGWCYTFENIVFVCEKPCEIILNEQNQLHKNGDMALKYSDGYGLYMLNGVNVPKYLATTSEDRLDINFFKKEKNADIKAEFVRKYGIERMKNMGKKIDSWRNYEDSWWKKSEYELIDMSPIFETIDYAPYINMKNQTTGIYHLEAVHPDCKTLIDAFEKTRWNGRKIDEYIIRGIQ